MHVAGAHVHADLRELAAAQGTGAGRAAARSCGGGGAKTLAHGLVVVESASVSSPTVTSAINSGIPIVLIEWVKQCLMEQQICKIKPLREQIKQEAARQAKSAQ